jgi:NAD(P)-dependent dehydrogenase (short-subunit alcohol dehydrogenase family)
VNVASVTSKVARIKLSAYVTSRHAVLGLDCAAHGIRVNAVGPGYVDTPLLAQKDADTRRSNGQLRPLNRMAQAEEVTEAILWLCSDESGFCTGSYYPVDGGFYPMKPVIWSYQ